MKVTVLTVIAALLSCALNAQELKVTSFELDVQDLEAKLNPVFDDDGEPSALIRVKTTERDMAFSGQVTGIPCFDGTEWTVYTKKGSESLTMKAKGIPSLTYRFKEEIEPAYVYVMQLDAIRPERYEVFIMPGISWHPSHTSYGLTVGIMKRFGAYLKVKSDFNGNTPTSGTCTDQGRLSNGIVGWFTGESVKSRASVTAGGLAHIKGPLTAYAGIGYGHRFLMWEDMEHSYFKVASSSVEGIEAETGVMVEAGFIILSAGISETGGKWLEGTMGVGIRF